MYKILIADDEANILMLLEIMLKDLNAKVITAENGEIAIEKAKEFHPDLVITDVVMPKKNGFEVCREIRNTQAIADTPIIILSALGDEYNKITGFEEGANDYMIKPFNIEELKSRTKALLHRHQNKTATYPQNTVTIVATPSITAAPPVTDLNIIPTHIPKLDQHLNGGLPKGSNILVLGPIGKGKSSFARNFIYHGLLQNDPCLFVAIDDDPKRIRQSLASQLNAPTQDYEAKKQLCFVDAYSWSSLTQPDDEPFIINGSLELNQLSGVISDAGYEVGQTVQRKKGGRRVLDSISSLLVNFELASAQRFLSQVARTSTAFGDATTLFVMEDGTVSEQVLNNIRYIMDGVIEFNEHEGKRSVRVASMKWMKTEPSWVEIESSYPPSL